MATMFEGFSGFFTLVNLGKYALLFFFFLIFCVSIVGIVIWVLKSKRDIRVIEINQNRKVMDYKGVYKKKKGSDIVRFYSKKIKRHLPKFQERDLLTKKGNDVLMLFKDNNGLFHSLRVPTFKQIKKWYEVQYDIDLDDTQSLNSSQSLIRSVYLEPSPHENLDWLANQMVEADTEFKNFEWWQHPNIMIGMSIGGAMIIQIFNLMFLYLMNK